MIKKIATNKRIISVLSLLIFFSSFVKTCYAAEIAPANNQLYIKEQGWQSFNNNNSLNIGAGRWITGQRGVVALNGARGDYFTGTVNFYIHSDILTYYLNGTSANIQCFATQAGTLWNAIGNKSFKIGGFNVEEILGTNFRDGYHISASFTGQSNEVITDINNFACEFYLSNGLLAQNATNGTIAALQGHWNGTNSNITVSFASDATEAINNLNQTLINQREEDLRKEQEEKNQLEETGENAEEQGENAGEQASQKGQTLMQAFSSLITAIGNIHETNCQLPNFSIYGMEFNNMNMCIVEVPNGLIALASIGMVFIIVPLGINLVKRMIALYNEIVGGK